MNVTVVTLIFFVLAVVVFIQLRSVLGQRTGHERPPFDPYSKTEKAAEQQDGDIINPAARPARHQDYADIDALAPAGSALNNGLRAIRKVDPEFAPAAFKTGVQDAYEIIMSAFARGERAVLKRLLSEDVYADFVQAIEKRQKEGKSVRFSFVGMDKADITAAALHNGHEAQITLLLVSQVISATYDHDGELLEGDPQAIVGIRDVWTFARDIRSKDPNWKLIATDEA